MFATDNVKFTADRYFDLIDRWKGKYIATIAVDGRVCVNQWRVEDIEGAVDEKTYPVFADVKSRAMRRFLSQEYGIADDYIVREV